MSANRQPCFDCRFQLPACVLIVVLAAPRACVAHPVSMSTVEIDVRRDRVDVELQVLVEELTLHYPISASGEGIFPAKELRKHAESHASFLKKDLLLLDGKGKRLECLATEVLSEAIPDEGVAETDLKNRSVKYRLRFSSVGETGFVTVSQTFGGKDAILPSIMDCMVLQEGVLADVPAQLLSRQSMTVPIDWDSPPKPLKNWRELRERRQKQLRERLGIASYGGLYSFIYVTPFEVRHEVLVPLLTLETWLPIERRDPEFLDVQEQRAARAKIEKLFTERNPVTINGTRVKPVVDRVNFFGLDIRDFAVNSKPRRVGVYQGRVGIILSYAASSSPRSVQLKWELFNKHAGFLRSIVYIHDGDPVEHFLRPDEEPFSWQSPLEVTSLGRNVKPVVSRLSRAAGRKEAEQISAALLGNIYRAFEFRDEEETYDALASSVDGPLLRTLYLQIRKSLLMAEQGNARSRIVAVRPVSSTLDDAAKGRFDLDLTWRATGQVEHWGHIHSRENEYRARLSVAEKDGHWKLVGCRFLGQKRLRFQTNLRTKKR